MRILVAGATGLTGSRAIQRLAAEGHAPVAMVRESSDTATLPQGCETRLADLTDLPADVTEGVEAVLFAAGAGSGTGQDMTEKVDRDGAKALVDLAKRTGVTRFVMLSSVGTDRPEEGPDKMRPYLEAKAEADRHLAQSGLDYTIVRPVSLTTDDGTGRIELSTGHVDGKTIPRDDVAAVLASSLTAPEARNATFEIAGGDTAIPEAIRSV